MDALTRLGLRYRNPAALGLSSADDLTALLAQAAKADSYDAALEPLLEAEISTLRQQVESLKSASGATITYGLGTRLTSLENELRLLRLRLYPTATGSGLRIQFGSPTWMPTARLQDD